MENQATIHENDIENNFSDENLKKLAEEIQSTLKIVKNSKRPSTQDCIISSVNPLLRRVNEAAYRPYFVIIGPLRCYDSLWEQMEMQKRIHMDSFLQRAENNASLEEFCQLIKVSAAKIRGCYEETYYRSYDFLSHKIEQNISTSDHRSSGLFIEMILVDASFIIELFLRAYYKEESGFINKRWSMHDIRRDLFLAHNQLPLFILKDIYELAFRQNSGFPSFIHLTCHFFSHYYNQNTSIEEIMAPSLCHDEYRAKLESAQHFTDFLRILQLPYSFQNYCSSGKSLCCRPKFVDRIRSLLLPSSKEPGEDIEAGKVQGEYLYSAVLLHEAGVKFKVSSSRCLLDIKFNRNNGELKIPPLRVDGSTESFFRNLMAWEQSYDPRETPICDYIFLMGYLIQFADDVDLLVRKRIIINQLGSHTAVVTLFNNFCKQITPTEKNYYSGISRELNAYNAVRHHSWIAILRLQYFSTPWRGVATIAAVILLVLTLIQTIFSGLSLK